MAPAINEIPGRPYRSTASWLVLAVLIGAFALAAFFVMRARVAAGRGMPEFSVYSAERNGLARTAWLLRQLGWQTIAVTRPIHLTRHTGLLIMVEPQEQSGVFGVPAYWSESEARGLLAWVAEGNTLLLAGKQTTRLHRELGVSVRGKPDTGKPTLYRAAPSYGGFTQQIEQLAVEGRLTLASQHGLPLWWIGDQPGALLLGHGAGRVLFVADPSLLTHRGLVRQDNVMFLYNLARLGSRDGVVFFDEYHHGLRASSGYWSYLRYHRHQWVIVQLLAVFGVAAWGLSRRLGPAKATPHTSRADAVDYASAVARIYQQAGVRHRLARWLAVDFLSKLTKHLRLRRSAAPQEILAAWNKHLPAAGGPPLQPLLHGLDRLQASDRSQPILTRELLQWAKAFDSFLFAHDMR